MWDNRYSAADYAYGKMPNVFFKSMIDQYQPSGNILLAAEGEGRNAVYAAQKGLDVFAFDISQAGQQKAQQLAQEVGVQIHYQVGNFLEMDLAQQQYDVLGLIYAHLPPSIRSTYYQKMANLVKPNGLVILEGFSEAHLDMQKQYPNIGGPKSLDFLFSIAAIKADFKNFEILQLEDVEIALQEGLYHIGKGRVIRFVGRKIG